MRIAGKLFPTVALALCALLTGCGFGSRNTAAGDDDLNATSFGGKIYGGQSPIIGAHIYVFEAGVATGNVSTTYHSQKNYAAAPTSLLGSSSSCYGTAVADGDGNCYVTTDFYGNYTVTAYNTTGCSTKDANGMYPQVYLLAVGGNTGNGSNANVVHAVAFGDCANLATATTIDLNEITTVITATALQQFANFSTGFTVTPEGFSSSSTNTAGLHRAMLTVSNLVNIASPATVYSVTNSNAAGSIPVALITDFANVIGTCVNSVTTDADCGNLTKAITGITETKDTLWDALTMAQNPTSNVSTAWSLIGSQSAFGKQLSSAPNDWSIGIDYSSVFNANQSIAEGLAVDGNGNIWIAPFNLSNATAEELIELDTVGNIVVGSATEDNNTSYKERFVAVDPSGNIWTNGNKTEVWDPAVSPYPYREVNTTGLSTTTFGMAFDTGGNAWVTNGVANSISEADYVSGATALSNLTASATSSATGISANARDVAIDSNNYAWEPNYTGGNTVAVFKVTGGSTSSTITAVSGSPFAVNTGTATNYNVNPWFVAIDANNYAFVAMQGAYAEFTPANSSGGPVLQSGNSGFGATTGGLHQSSIAIDGVGEVWLANYASGATLGTPDTTSSSIQKFDGATAASPGTVRSGTSSIKSDQTALDEPFSMAIDSSGNIWIANTASNIHTYSSISEFIGLAAPVTTPLNASKLALLP